MSIITDKLGELEELALKAAAPGTDGALAMAWWHDAAASACPQLIREVRLLQAFIANPRGGGAMTLLRDERGLGEP